MKSVHSKGYDGKPEKGYLITLSVIQLQMQTAISIMYLFQAEAYFSLHFYKDAENKIGNKNWVWLAFYPNICVDKKWYQNQS